MMAASEADIVRDEQERGNLQSALRDLETAMAVSTPGTRRLLELSLAGIKAQVATLDKKIEEAKVERATEAQTQAAIAAAMAAKESKLSEEERETYRQFLEKAYFTKKDFGSLDEFYRHSYDRLSEGGKEQMSQRIDEGIRRGEFEFSDLPKAVRTKEAEHRVAKDREPSPEQAEVSKGKASDTPAKPSNEASAIKDINFASVNLSGVTMQEATTPPSSASIPDASTSKSVQRSV